MESPNSRFAIPVASISSYCRASTACRMRLRNAPVRKSKSRSRWNCDTGITSALTMTRVRSASTVRSASELAPTTRSHASSTSAAPVCSAAVVRTRGACIDSQVTEHGPAFLSEASHIERRGALALQVCGHRQEGTDGHHACATDADDALNGESTRTRGSGTAVRSSPSSIDPEGLRTRAPSTSTNDGQNPLTQL